MKRRWFGVFCALWMLLLLALPALAADQENTPVITRYEAAATVDQYGDAAMTVTVDMTIPTPLTELDFPIGKGSGGAVAGQTVKSVGTDDGTVLRLSSEAGISGERTFVITYTVSRAVAATEEGQKLTLELIAPGWQWPMEQASFSVTMPSAYTAAPVYVGGYYGDVVQDYMDVQSDGTTFSGTFTEALRDHDSLQATLNLPANYVNLRSANGISGLVTLILVAVLCLGCVFYWYRTLRNPRLSVRLRPLAPDGAGAGDLPMLLTCGKPSLPLQVMQWASLGYLAIHINHKRRIVLRKTMDVGSERRRQEQAVFGKLFEKDPWCDGESLRFGRLSQRYTDAMTAFWNRRLFSKTSGSPALLHLAAAVTSGIAVLGSASAGLPASRLRGVLLVLFALVGIFCGVVFQRGLVAAVRRQYRPALLCAIAPLAMLVLARILGGLLPVALALLLQVFAALSTLRGGRRSPGGRDSLAQTLGFQRYIRHVSQHQLALLLRDDSQYFYRMLPFAEAMGLGEAFAKRFGEIQLEPCDWYETEQRLPQTAAGFYQEFQATLQRMERARNR